MFILQKSTLISPLSCNSSDVCYKYMQVCNNSGFLAVLFCIIFHTTPAAINLLVPKCCLSRDLYHLNYSAIPPTTTHHPLPPAQVVSLPAALGLHIFWFQLQLFLSSTRAKTTVGITVALDRNGTQGSKVVVHNRL